MISVSILLFSHLVNLLVTILVVSLAFVFTHSLLDDDDPCSRSSMLTTIEHPSFTFVLFHLDLCLKLQFFLFVYFFQLARLDYLPSQSQHDFLLTRAYLSSMFDAFLSYPFSFINLYSNYESALK